MNDDAIDLSDEPGLEIDLRDEIDLHERLRFAAGSLAADFSGELTIALAEELVFNSAEGLLASASVTDFVPILAERRARRAFRFGTGAPLAAAPPAPPPSPPSPPSAAAPSAAAPTIPTASSPRPSAARPTGSVAASAAPLFAVSDDVLGPLREGVERVRTRVTEWQAGLTRR